MVALAGGAAAFSGFALSLALQEEVGLRNRQRRAKSLLQVRGVSGPGPPDPSVPGSLALRIVWRQSRLFHSNRMRRFAASRIWGVGLKDADRMLARAGLSGSATPEGIRMARIQTTAAGVLVGALVGAVFSTGFALVLANVGLIGGYALVPRALKSRADARNADMERHLSQMVEVVVLGLRSGLSFERSFSLYPRYFDTELGRSMLRVTRQWDAGLASREDALRLLEAEYDSPLLARVVGSMVRSLRFGTSTADSLEAAAVEAREVHRSRMEEKVAKVAVKMMLPVGTLILPAMLLLVLGPVMLELMQGF